MSPSVQQAGSKVSPSGLRFDFVDPQNQSEQVTDLADKVAAYVRQVAERGLDVATQETSLERARSELKATALFGEKYGDRVRVVHCGDVSTELCGGTHVKNTKELLPFEVVSIRSVGAGVKRLEARVGVAAEQFARQREEEQAAATARAARFEEEKQRAALNKDAEVKPKLEFDTGNSLFVTSFGSDLDFAALKLAAHKLRKARPERTHVALSEQGGTTFVVVASEGLVDARHVLGVSGAKGGGNASFAAGAAKGITQSQVLTKFQQMK